MASGLYPEEKPRVAILDFTPENTETTYARAVRNIFEISLFKTNKFRILERDKIESILKEQGFQMSGCTDTSCAVEIGRILSADMVVTGSLNKISGYTIAVRFIDITGGNILLADSETASNDEGIRKAVNILAERMAGNITGDAIQPQKIAEPKEKNIVQAAVKRTVFQISVYGSYLFPSGTFDDIAGTGFGAGTLLYTGGIPFPGMIAGIETGYLYFKGKEDNIDYCSIIPVLAVIGYRYEISGFSITPTAKAGIGYNAISYDADGISSGGKAEYEIKRKMEFLAKAGAIFEYSFTEKLSAQIGAEYAAVFEKDKNLYFTSINAGIGYRF